MGLRQRHNLDELPGRVELAVGQARLAGNGSSELAPVAPVVDTVPAEADKNPVVIPLAEKKRVLDDYNDIIWRIPQIQTSIIGYAESHKKVVFLSSSGSHIEQERADRSEEHTSELQSHSFISYSVFCLKKKKKKN